MSIVQCYDCNNVQACTACLARYSTSCVKPLAAVCSVSSSQKLIPDWDENQRCGRVSGWSWSPKWPKHNGSLCTRMSLPFPPTAPSPFISPFAINHSAFRSSAPPPPPAEAAELHKLGKQWHILLGARTVDRAQFLHIFSNSSLQLWNLVLEFF